MRVREATLADRDGAVATLIRAFADDPVIRWFFPDEATYPRQGESFFGFLIDVRLEGGLVLVTDDRSAVSSWDPPGGNRRGQGWVEERWDAATAELEPAALTRLDRFEDEVAPMHPRTPYWYLGIVGVDPARRGTGLGRAVIEPGLAAADRQGTTTFLETGTAENLAIYARLGFTTVHRTRIPGGPALWGLRRAPTEGDSRTRAS